MSFGNVRDFERETTPEDQAELLHDDEFLCVHSIGWHDSSIGGRLHAESLGDRAAVSRQSRLLPWAANCRGIDLYVVDADDKDATATIVTGGGADPSDSTAESSTSSGSSSNSNEVGCRREPIPLCPMAGTDRVRAICRSRSHSVSVYFVLRGDAVGRHHGGRRHRMFDKHQRPSNERTPESTAPPLYQQPNDAPDARFLGLLKFEGSKAESALMVYLRYHLPHLLRIKDYICA
jgi:hypothetical protein